VSTPTPQLPGGLSKLPPDLSKCWTIYYRHGVNSTLSKNFFCEGSLEQARDRAMKHCGVMGYKYIFIRPMLCDIEYEEGIQQGTIDPRTGLVREGN
jgi:hypothetical protein